MKISTKGRYGVRFLIDIAEQGLDKPTTLAEISMRQDISSAYLGQIAVALKRAGYIRSIKGSSGGFILAMQPSEIHLDTVLQSLEGDLKIVDPPLPTEEETPFRKALRIGLYEKIDENIVKVLGNLTLDKLIAGGKSAEYMYYI